MRHFIQPVIFVAGLEEDSPQCDAKEFEPVILSPPIVSKVRLPTALHGHLSHDDSTALHFLDRNIINITRTLHI